MHTHCIFIHVDNSRFVVVSSKFSAVGDVSLYDAPAACYTGNTSAAICTFVVDGAQTVSYSYKYLLSLNGSLVTFVSTIL